MRYARLIVESSTNKKGMLCSFENDKQRNEWLAFIERLNMKAESLSPKKAKEIFREDFEYPVAVYGKL